MHTERRLHSCQAIGISVCILQKANLGIGRQQQGAGGGDATADVRQVDPASQIDLPMSPPVVVVGADRHTGQAVAADTIRVHKQATQQGLKCLRCYWRGRC